MQIKTLLTFVRTTELYKTSFNHITAKTRCFALNSSTRNPYDVLGLKSTCSTQDVKKAYIKLCKELHPDMKPGDVSQHKKFVELNNAYTSLVNAESRRQVDNKFSSGVDNLRDIFYWNRQEKPSGPFEQAQQRGEQWYEREDYKNQFQQQRRKGNIPTHLQNNFTLTLCFLLVCIGAMLYFSAYKYATNYTMKIVDEKSRKIKEEYEDVRKSALVSGREEQVEKLRKRWNL